MFYPDQWVMQPANYEIDLDPRYKDVFFKDAEDIDCDAEETMNTAVRVPFPFFRGPFWQFLVIVRFIRKKTPCYWDTGNIINYIVFNSHYFVGRKPTFYAHSFGEWSCREARWTWCTQTASCSDTAHTARKLDTKDSEGGTPSLYYRPTRPTWYGIRCTVLVEGASLFLHILVSYLTDTDFT